MFLINICNVWQVEAKRAHFIVSYCIKLDFAKQGFLFLYVDIDIANKLWSCVHAYDFMLSFDKNHI